MYINDPGYEVPDNTIVVVPDDWDNDGYYTEIITPLKGEVKRDWFNSHFYYCLPINIGNQYGFVINSMRDFDIEWNGKFDDPNDIKITFLNNDNSEKQYIKCGFTSGVLTIQNHFYLKTPPGINLMTIQPPNLFIPTCIAMTGVIETDQIRRDFTFNIKMTLPNYKVSIRKGDPLGAFMPVPRYFVDNFNLKLMKDLYSKEVWDTEISESKRLKDERMGPDKEKPHMSGRRYFNGNHSDGSLYTDHQKKLV